MVDTCDSFQSSRFDAGHGHNSIWLGQPDWHWASRISEPVGSAAVDLRFEDADGGFIRIVAASRNGDPLLIPPGQDGFIRTALRGLVQERRTAGAGPETPFRLGRTDDNRLWLRDLSTDRLLYLDAYGYHNAQRFARLFDHFIRSKE